MPGIDGKVVLDTDAAVLLGDSALSREFFTTLPVAMTGKCVQELENLTTDDDGYVANSAQDADFHRKRGNVERLPPAGPLSPDMADLSRELTDRFDIDPGEKSILDKLLADDPEYWVVGLQDSDGRAAILRAKSEASLSVRYVGTPAKALCGLHRCTGITEERCLAVLENEAEKEGWDWEKLEPVYRAEFAD